MPHLISRVLWCFNCAGYKIAIFRPYARQNKTVTVKPTGLGGLTTLKTLKFVIVKA